MNALITPIIYPLVDYITLLSYSIRWWPRYNPTPHTLLSSCDRGMSNETMSSSTATRILQNMSTMPSPWDMAPMRSWKNLGQVPGYSNWSRSGGEAFKSPIREESPSQPTAAAYLASGHSRSDSGCHT